MKRQSVHCVVTLISQHLLYDTPLYSIFFIFFFEFYDWFDNYMEVGDWSMTSHQPPTH